MKRFVFTLISLSFLASCVNDVFPPQDARVDAGLPAIQVAPSVVDAGPQDQGTPSSDSRLWGGEESRLWGGQ